MAPNPKTVIVDFLCFCADQTHPLPTRDSKYCAAMRYFAGQVMKTHRKELEQLWRSYEAAADIDFFLYRLCDVVFDDKKSVGRLISIFAFAGILSLHRRERDNAVLCSCISGFIKDNLTDWLEISDSWNHLCRLHLKNVKLGDTNWKNFCLKENYSYVMPAYNAAIIVAAAMLFCYSLF